MKKAFLFFIIIFIFSCKEKKKEETKKVNDTTIQTIQKKIKYNTLIYPNKKSYLTELQATGLLFNDEFSEKKLKNKWFGLFKNKSKFYLSKTKIIASKAFHPLEDNNVKEKSGWNVKTTNKDTCIVLINELTFLNNHKIKKNTIPKSHFFPGESLKFNYLNKTYIIFATGDKKKIPNSPNRYIVWNYKLYITTLKNRKSITELLVSIPKMSDFMVDVIFSGDIDNDGIIDLLIETSKHYSYSKTILYLSKPAQKHKLLKPIGFCYTSGC